MLDLGTLGGRGSQGFGINASGHVAGLSLSAAGIYRPFLYDGTMHDLGTLGGSGGRAYGINSHGQVTGSADTTGDLTSRAFLYTTGSGMVDLNSLIPPLSGWVLDNARGINDAGQITGDGVIRGELHAFLLTPVPEPATLALIALGLPLLISRREALARLGGVR
jgi:probable HAF family extracellular repeat protein